MRINGVVHLRTALPADSCVPIGGTVPAFELLAGAKTITGLSMAWFARTQPELYRRQGDELWHLARTGRLRPVVHAEIPLADAARAHAMIEARANLGKVVLCP